MVLKNSIIVKSESNVILFLSGYINQLFSHSLHILLDKLDTNSLYLKIMQLNIFVRNLKTHTFSV